MASVGLLCIGPNLWNCDASESSSCLPSSTVWALKLLGLQVVFSHIPFTPPSLGATQSFHTWEKGHNEGINLIPNSKRLLVQTCNVFIIISL